MKRLLILLAAGAAMQVSAAELTLSCIGPESDDCPVAVDATLQTERLSASFRLGSTGTTPNRVVLDFCTGSATSGAGWYADICVSSGTHRVLNGELTKRQLAEGAIIFETRKTQAVCLLNGSQANAKPICTKVQ